MNESAVFPEAPRIIVIGDIHGDLARLTRVLIAAQIINRQWAWTADPPNTVVVQMGDQLDSANRDPAADAWETAADLDVILFMEKLDRIARGSGGRVISLIGNHEIMNLMGDYTYVSEKSLAKSDGVIGRSRSLGPNGCIRDILLQRYPAVQIGRLVFTHAGLLPAHLDALSGPVGAAAHPMNRMLQLFRRGFRNEWLDPQSRRVFNELFIESSGILWTREYMMLRMNSPGYGEIARSVEEVLDRLGAASIFIGHNTVSAIDHRMDGRVWFSDAMFSRSYGSTGAQIIDVRSHEGHYDARILTFSGI